MPRLKPTVLLFPPGNTGHAQELPAIRARIYADATSFRKDEALYLPTMEVQMRDFFAAMRANGIVFNFLRLFHFDHLLSAKI